MSMKSLVVGDSKRCPHCKEYKQVFSADGSKTFEHFNKSNGGKLGFQSWCRECQKKDGHVNHIGKAAHNAIKATVIAKSTSPVVTDSAYVKPSSEALAPTVNAPVATVQPCYSFVEVDGRLINVEDVSVVDPVAGGIDIVMRSTEMDKQGFVHSRVYHYSGAAAEIFKAAIQIASGKLPTTLLDKIAALESGIKLLKGVNSKLEAERDAAMTLAGELEEKHNSLKKFFQ